MREFPEEVLKLRVALCLWEWLRLQLLPSPKFQPFLLPWRPHIGGLGPWTACNAESHHFRV